jgi:hypothetical protein
MWGFSCRCLTNQISRRILVITSDREGWGLGTGWIRSIPQIARRHVVAVPWQMHIRAGSSTWDEIATK